MLARLRIGSKLLLAPGALVLLLVVLACGAYYAMLRQNASLGVIVRQRAVHMRSVADLVASAQHAHTGSYRLQTWISGSFANARTDALVRELRRRHAAIERGFAALGGLASEGSAEAALVQRAESAWRVYLAAVLDVIELARNDQSISANAMGRAERAFDTMALHLDALSRLEQQLAEQASAGALDDFTTVSTLMPVLLIVSVAVALMITMAVRRALLDDLAGIEARAAQLASGDLSVRAACHGRDEIAATTRALDKGIEALGAQLRIILASAREIGAASRALAQVRQTGEAVNRSTHDAHGAVACDLGQALVQVDAMTRQNGALVEETALAAARLQRQALLLAQAVLAFRLDAPDQAQKGRPHLRLVYRNPYS